MKSTSPESDFIIMCVNTDKKINMIQNRDPIKFEDIISLSKKSNLKKIILKNNNIKTIY